MFFGVDQLAALTFFIVAALFFAGLFLFMRRAPRPDREIREPITFTSRPLPSPPVSLAVPRNPLCKIEGSADFDMRYRDADGAATARRISFERLYPGDGFVYVEAYCHLRRAPRTFRSDRIAELVSVETGEIFDGMNGDWSVWRLPPVEKGSDFASVRQKAGPGLAILVYVAMADHDLAEAEMEILLDYAAERDALTGNGGMRDWSRVAMAASIDMMSVRKAEAEGHLSRMKERERAIVAEHALRIIGLDVDGEGKTRRRAVAMRLI